MVPSPLDWGWQSEWAGQGQGQAPRYPANWALARLHLGPGTLPRAVTRHALLLVREASPSCFQSFITVLFVVQQIKFFGGSGGGEGERREKRGEKIQITSIRSQMIK